jgi:hypothetical protein
MEASSSNDLSFFGLLVNFHDSLFLEIKDQDPLKTRGFLLGKNV